MSVRQRAASPAVQTGSALGLELFRLQKGSQHRLAVAGILDEPQIVSSTACVRVAAKRDTIGARQVVLIRDEQVRIAILLIGHHDHESVCKIDACAAARIPVLAQSDRDVFRTGSTKPVPAEALHQVGIGSDIDRFGDV